MELWVGDLAGKQVTIDGKVSRGAKDTTTGRSALHILRAWVSEASLSVGHEVCAEKSNELEALPRLLAKLQLHGATVRPARSKAPSAATTQALLPRLRLQD